MPCIALVGEREACAVSAVTLCPVKVEERVSLVLSCCWSFLAVCPKTSIPRQEDLATRATAAAIQRAKGEPRRSLELNVSLKRSLELKHVEQDAWVWGLSSEHLRHYSTSVCGL